MRISDWSSDVCSSDLRLSGVEAGAHAQAEEVGFLLCRREGERRIAARLGEGVALGPHMPEPRAGRDRGGAPPGVVGDPTGRASCRERVCQYVWISVVAVSFKQKQQ